MPHTSGLPRLFLSPPHMGGNEQHYIQAAFDANYIAPLGANVTDFEKRVASYTQSPHAVALSCGTAAIHLALILLGVKAGDPVLASSFTFIGSVSPIIHLGAEPIFIDADTNSWNLDPALLEEALHDRQQRALPMPRVLILTHLYGQPANVDALAAVCQRYGVTIIEDAAESLGATWRGRHTGTLGTFGILSFNGNKIITTSGGGMLLTPSAEYAKQALYLATQARQNTPHYEHTDVGYNYRMSNIVAGIGCGQMEVLAERVARKRDIFTLYQTLLADIECVHFMPELPHACGNRWLTTITVDHPAITPETLRLHMEAQNIESRPLWKPMHLQPVFRNAQAYTQGVSEKLFATGLCLPSGTAMSDSDIERVATLVRHCIERV